MENEKIRTATSLKCPSCGGEVSYDPEEERLCCDSCSSSFSLDEFVDYEKDWQPSVEQDWEELKGPEINKDEVHIYTCPTCGAGVMTDALSATAECPYCDSDLVLNDKLKGVNMPKGIIPFKQTREFARMTMRRLAAEKAGIPEKKIKEEWIQDIQGVYMPYWIFDCGITTVGVYSGKTNWITYGDVGAKVSNETEYNVTCIASSRIDGIPARASDRFKESSVRKLYPFDMSEMVDFNPALISGYKVMLQDLTPEMEKDIVQAEVDRHLLGNKIRDMVSQNSNYSTVTPLFAFSKVKKASYSYCLLPMWTCDFNYKGRKYIFGMNGQTGEAMIEQPPGVAEQWRKDNMGLAQKPHDMWPARFIFEIGFGFVSVVVAHCFKQGIPGIILAAIIFAIGSCVYYVWEGRRQLEHMREGTRVYEDDPEGLYEGPAVSVLGYPGELKMEVYRDERRRTRKKKMDSFLDGPKIY